MFGSVVLEVGIGLIITFLLFSLVLTSLQEGIESLLKRRAQGLEKAIAELIDGKPGEAADILERFYEHPLIYPLYHGSYAEARSWGEWPGFNLPSYVPSTHFAAALSDLVATGDVDPSYRVREVFRLVDNGTDGSATRALSGLEAWYDAAMARLSGRYKRKTQLWLFGMGLLAAAWLNINPIRIAGELAHNQQLRENVVALAPMVQANTARAVADIEQGNAAPAPREDMTEATTLLDSAGLPIGWEGQNRNDWPRFALGWLITALAGMLGAPFWFDLLSKMMNVRGSLRAKVDETDGSNAVPAHPFPGAATLAGLTPGSSGSAEHAC